MKIVHALIDCAKCHKECTKYLNEPAVTEVVIVDEQLRDYCISCADKHHDESNKEQ